TFHHLPILMKMIKQTYLTLLVATAVTFTNIAWADNKKATPPR
ncbi:MAG: hypothetical protein RLY82_156, partial [Pseudomonadota bacterium]